MKLLKSITVFANTVITKACYQDGDKLHNTVIETIPEKKITDLAAVVQKRLNPGEELDQFLCQITPDQHKSEERIRYQLEGGAFRFLPVSSLIVATELKLYNEVKTLVQSEIDAKD